MITILISENENKIREMINQILLKERHTVSEKESDKIINIAKKQNMRDIAGIKDTVVELENSLYDEKKGALYKSILEIIEKPMLERVLERTEGNQVKAAKILGINRNTMRAKIKKLGINPQMYKQ